MPKFVRYQNDTKYWLWNEDKMRLENRNFGHQDVNEKNPRWLYAEIIEAKNWHDLYMKTGWSDLWLSDCHHNNLWVDPEGECWEGEAHEVVAEDILEVVYGEETKLSDYPADKLINRGWIKLSVFMAQIYADSDMYFNITRDQAITIKEWCEWAEIPFSWFCKTDLY